MIIDYLKNFKNDFTEQAKIGVFNCLWIIELARNGNMSNEDFSELDLRMCSLVGKDCTNSDFSKSKISRHLFFDGGKVTSGVDISYDGRYIICGYDDNTVKIWENTTGKTIRTLIGHKDKVHIVNYSQDKDSRYIVSASWDNTIKIWKSETGKLLHSFKGHQHWNINSVEFSPDGKYVVSTSSDKTIKIWDSATGKLKHTIGRRLFVQFF